MASDDVYIERFTATERAVHWVHATAFFGLLATGLVLYVPRLSILIGRRPLVKNLHVYTAVAWIAALLLVVVLGDRRRLRQTLRELDEFDADDLLWLRRRPAPQGRFNAGQKVNAVLTGAFALLFAVSGSLLWLGERDHRFQFASTILLHDWLMYLSLDLARRPFVPRPHLSGDPPFLARDDPRLGPTRLGRAAPCQMGCSATTMSQMTTVLVVDDEPIVRDVVVRYLRRDGFDTLEAADGDAARTIIESGAPDLVVLDLMLPGTDGLALCSWIRTDSALPVIMVTARGEAADRIVGLELGADDYVTKPFSPRELAIRVRNVLKRTDSAPSAAAARKMSFDALTIDGKAREVTLDGQLVRLTGKEFDLLFFLASNPREVFSRKQLMDRVWGYEAAFDTGTVTVHIRRLRSKIERDPSQPRRLETLWGVGYRFVP